MAIPTPFFTSNVIICLLVTTRVDKRESVELVVKHCVPSMSYTMNIDSVIAIQLHFVVYSIWLQPTLPS